jgi:transcriptional regulator with XRE-family HTH domain
LVLFSGILTSYTRLTVVPLRQNTHAKRQDKMIQRTSVPAGQALKALRNRWNITIREVERASHRIADAKGDKRFSISNGWLAQLENGVSEPSFCKLFSLSVIYRADFLDLVRLYHVVDFTQLLSQNGNGHSSSITSLEQKHLAESMKAPECAPAQDCEPHIIYGRLGLADFTMSPLIRPGALLKIDTRQNKLNSVQWHNEYERPVHFIELRGAYACGWCELQGNHLLIIPHPSSPAPVRQFTYPREADIVGRVVGYSTSCIDGATESQPHQVTRSSSNRRRSAGSLPG